MSIVQDKAKELRFIRRKELTEESKVIGNYYRDIIRAYGIDCHYFKMKVPEMEKFHQILDQNNLLLNAYGYDDHPCYEISADMITYMEVDNDIFNLNKFGIVPNTDVTFYFDSTDFAIALAEKVGQLKEYKIYEKEIVRTIDFLDPNSLCIITDFGSDIMSGMICFNIGACDCGDNVDLTDLSQTFTTLGCPFEHTKPKIVFPTNEYLYKSFNYKLEEETFSNFIGFLDFNLSHIVENKYSLSGKMYGGILFKDLEIVGKYADFIKPQVGDVVTIDFPDELNREQYEITECSDKQLTNDGINPLLHTYVWKCRAKRFVDAENNLPETNLANEQINEKIDLNKIANDVVSEKISIYPDDEDKIYGGYSATQGFHDVNALTANNILGYYEIADIDDGSLIDIFSFSNGNRMCTNGYDLFFVIGEDKAAKINLTDDNKDKLLSSITFGDEETDSSIQFLKATEKGVFFVNVEGNVYKIIGDYDMPPKEMELCLNSLVELTIYGNNASNPNQNGDTFLKFRNCNTVMFSIGKHLYCRTIKKVMKVI